MLFQFSKYLYLYISSNSLFSPTEYSFDEINVCIENFLLINDISFFRGASEVKGKGSKEEG